MAEHKLIGKDYATPDIVAKVTGKAKYAEDFRATRLDLSGEAILGKWRC